MAASKPLPFNLSDEDPTKTCDPCSYQGVNTQAVTFCTVCSEYLCHSCENYHRSLKMSRDHELKPFGEEQRRTIKQRALVSSIMTCGVHNTESLTQFCVTHATAVCGRCFNKKHRQCDVKPVRDISRKPETKTDIEQFLGSTQTLLKEIKGLKSSRKTDKEQIQNSCEKSKQEVQDMKRKAIEWIENLAHDMEDRISNIEEELTTEVDNDISAIDDMSEEIEGVLDSFETLDTVDEDATFVLMTKEKHKTDDGEEAKDQILKSIKPFELEFHPSDQLVTILSEITEIGTFDKYQRQAEMTSASMCGPRDPPICFTEIASLVREQNVDMGLQSVSGCVFLSDGRLVVCEDGINSVQLYEEDFKLKSQKTISSIWDVAVISENQVIVTQRDQKSLKFLDVSDTIEEGTAIRVDMPCWGVACKNDRLYVSCHNNDGNGGVVKVLTLSGDRITSFRIDQGYPYYLAVNNTADRIVVSKGWSGIEWFDIHGTALSSYTDSQLSYSQGVVYDSCDNVMVCGYGSNNIHVVDSNGTKHKVLLTQKDGISSPRCLAYRNSDKTLVVGQFSSTNGLLVFKCK